MPAEEPTSNWLAELGVTPDHLSPEQRRQLDEDGFLVLPHHMPDQLLAQFRERTADLLRIEGHAAGHETPQSGGVAALANLLNKGEVFDRCFTDPTVLAAAAQVLGPEFRVNSLNYRAALPHQGHQGLHADWPTAVAADDYHLINSMWCLDDFTQHNGATRAVPGSHRWAKLPRDVMEPTDDHPDQIYLTAPAGSLIIFNGHLWHGGTQNNDDRPRRGMTMSYCRRDEPQQLNQRDHVLKIVYDRLSPSERHLLDV